MSTGKGIACVKGPELVPGKLEAMWLESSEQGEEAME